MCRFSTRLRRDLREETPEFFPETQMRPDDGERFRVEVRHVDRVADRALEQGGANRLRDFDADAFLRLRGRGAEMRREDRFGMPRNGESAGNGSVSKTSSAARGRPGRSSAHRPAPLHRSDRRARN